MNTIENRIRSRRFELGLTQTELASKLGYTSKAAILLSRTATLVMFL